MSKSVLVLGIFAALTAAPFARAEEASPPDDGTWSTLTGPPGRSDLSAIYDPVRHRTLVFGGIVGTMGLHDLWELTREHGWRRLLPIDSDSPDPRPYGCGRGAIYDPVRDRLLLFGGKSDSYFPNDVWALSLSGTPTWSHLAVAGTPPSGRTDHATVYDPDLDAMIVVGGYRHGVVLGDVWKLSLAGVPTWSRLEAAGGPLPRYRHAAIYDPAGKRIIVFGGSDGTTSQGTWALTFSGAPTWSQIPTAGDPPTSRIRHAAIHDAARRRMIVFGGTDGTRRNDAWALSLDGTPTWSALDIPGPRPSRRSDAAAVYDSDHDALVLFGGYEEPTQYPSDAWELTFGMRPQWKRVAEPFGQPPSSPYSGTVVYDPPRDRLIQFGGWFDGLNNELHALELSGARTWSTIDAPGDGPPPISGASAIHDPIRDRLIFFGGYGPEPGYSNEAWSLSLSGLARWSHLAPEGPRPAARTFPSAIYDPIRDRMIVFGGVSSRTPDDVWALSMSDPPAWTRLATTGIGPTGRYRHFAAYDALRDRMLVFAGQRDTTSEYASPREIWALSLSGIPAWSEITPAISPFHSGASQATVYDPVRDRLVAFAPWGPLKGNDVWALDLSGDFTWRLMNPAGAPASFQQPAFYDPLRDRMIAYGNDGLESPCVLTWGSPMAPGVSCDPAVTWMPGNVARVAIRLSNTIAGQRAVQWSVDVDPPIRGLARRGVAIVPGSSAITVPVDVTMPALAEAKLVTLRVSAAYVGAAGNETRDRLTIDVDASSKLVLHPVWPNPTRGPVVVSFHLPAPGRARLEIFDIAGRRVATREMDLQAGRHEVPLEAGGRRAAGVHLVRLEFEGRTEEARFVLVK